MYMYVYTVQCVLEPVYSTVHICTLEPTINMYMYSSLHLTCTCMCVVIHNSNIDLGSNSNSNLLILKVIVIVIHYIDLRGNSNMLHCIVIDPHVCYVFNLMTLK